MMCFLRRLRLTARQFRLLQSALIGCAVLAAACSGCEGTDVRQNPDGTYRGTGDIVYKYETGEKARVDSYVDGKLKRSEWFRPDGKRAFLTKWTGKGDGFEYYLYPNGAPKKKYTMRDGVAHGPAWEYDKRGKVTSKSMFVDGAEKVEEET